MSTQIKKFWQKHDQKILIFVAIILVAVVSFKAGQTHEDAKKTAEINVSLSQLAAANPAQEKILVMGEALERNGVDLRTNLVEDKKDGENSGSGNQDQKECALVGSKNSNKYHLLSCQWASKIKPENRVCFSSKEDAEAKGYIPAKCCNK